MEFRSVLFRSAKAAVDSGMGSLRAAGLDEAQAHRVLVLLITMRFRPFVQEPNEQDLTEMIAEIVDCCKSAERARDDVTPPVTLKESRVAKERINRCTSRLAS